MPYVSISTPKALSAAEKDALKSSVGTLIAIIPGKSEAVLMVDIMDDHAMYFRGKEIPCAFVDVRLYGPAPFEEKKDFTEQLCAAIEKDIGVPKGDIFLNIQEFGNWGSGGTFK